MVRVILDGRKTVTRRAIKNLDIEEENGLERLYEKDEDDAFYIAPIKCAKEAMLGYCQYQPGDILYVRETWSEWTDGYVYKAWTEPFPQAGQYETTKWHPSIHMPKEAARIWLKVTDVHVKRLLEMSVADAMAEGIDPKATRPNVRGAFREFQKVWDSTIKKSDLDRYGWEANPWVWVIEFERCDKSESEEDDE
jgi:uncharacterized protein YhfF